MRFCGMCGERLPDRSNRGAKTAPSDPDVVPPTTRVFSQKEDEAHPGHSEKWVEAPAGPGNPAATSFIPAGSQSRGASDVGPSDLPGDRGRSNPSNSLADSFAARRPAGREERRGRHDFSEPSSSSSGPSFLGLGSTDYEPPQREISWRFWALMLVLLGVVALFGLQWRANRLPAEQNKPGAAQNVNQPAGQ